MPLMHSEDIKDHDLLKSILESADLAEEVKGFLDGTLEFASAHRKVIEKFGRYPHRNKLYNRETTKEESKWLDSDEVPMWAKSQG